MSTVKMAVSVDEKLFDKANAIAKELHISRSKVVAWALKELTEKIINRKILEQINASYENHPPTEDERKGLEFGQALYGEILEKEDW